MPSLFQQQCRLKRIGATQRYAENADDGVFGRLLKDIFWLPLWHCPLPIWWAMCRSLRNDNVDKSWLEAEYSVNRATDWYVIFVSSVVALSYAIVYSKMDEHACFCSWIVPGIAVFRIIEILSVQVQLHTQSTYGTVAPVRALLNTLWHYVETVLIFALLYVVCARISENSFTTIYGSGKFLDDWHTPIYFSFQVITTLNSSEFEPNGFTRLLVALEVFVGLLLVVVVIQRVLAVRSENVDRLIVKSASRLKFKMSGDDAPDRLQVADLILHPSVPRSILLDSIVYGIQSGKFDLWDGDKMLQGQGIGPRDFEVFCSGALNEKLELVRRPR